MAKTTCPSCGAKIITDCIDPDINQWSPPEPLFQPALNKLREVYSRYNENGQLRYDNYVIFVTELWQAVREVLNE